MFQITSASTLSVTEGQVGETITVVTHCPPAFLCDTSYTSSDCTMLITAFVSDSSRDLGCPVTGTMPQIVLGASDASDTTGHSFCGQEITSSNWKNVLKIPVVAALDLVVDENEMRIVYVTGSVKTSNGNTLISQKLQDIEVNVG